MPASYAADMLGRRMGVTIGLVILFVGTIIQVVPTVNSSMFIAGRFLVGLGFVSSNHCLSVNQPYANGATIRSNIVGFVPKIVVTKH